MKKSRKMKKVIILIIWMIAQCHQKLTLKLKEQTTSISGSTISLTGKENFLFFDKTEKKIFEYNILNFEKISEKSIGCTPLTISEIKEGLEYVVGCVESKALVFAYNQILPILDLLSIGTGKILSTAGFKTSNFFLLGSEDGHVYKRDSSDGSSLGVFPEPGSSSAKIKTLEIIKESSFFVASFHSSEKCFSHYDSSNPATAPTSANCGFTERVYGMKHASFSGGKIYVAATILSGFSGRIYSYSAGDLQKESGVSISSISRRVRSITVAESLKYVIIIDQEKLKIYDESLEEVTNYNVGSDVQNSDYMHLNLHEERNIVALSTASDSSAEKARWLYELTDLCNNSCELGSCRYVLADPNLSCDKCSENSYAEDEKCKNCPNCCEGGCSLSSGELNCNTLKEGFLIKSGVCEEIVQKEDESEIADDIDYSVSKIGDTKFLFSFNSTIQNFTLGKELEAKITEEENKENFIFFLKKKIDSFHEFELSMETNETSYMKKVEIKISQVKNKNNSTYPEKLFYFFILKFPDSTLGLDEKQQNTTKSVMENYSQYGSFITTIAPALKFLALPTNLGFLIALLPFKFHSKFYFILRLFVTFPESDISSYFFEKYYDQENLKSHYFSVPRYPEMDFVSVYSRILTVKIILSIFFTLIYFGLRNSSGEKEEVNEIKNIILNISMKILTTIHHTDISRKLIYAFTTLSTQIQVFDYCVLLMDFIMTGYFQTQIVVYLNKRNQENDDKFFLSEVFNYDNKDHEIDLPMISLYNIQFLVKISAVFLLNKYSNFLAVFLMITSIYFLFANFWWIKKNNLSAMTLWFVRIIFFVENLTMILISLSQIWTSLQTNEGFWSGIIILFLLSIGMFLIVTIGIVIERVCFSKTEEKNIIYPRLDEEKICEIAENRPVKKAVIRFRKSIFQLKMENIASGDEKKDTKKRMDYEKGRHNHSMRSVSKLWRFSRNKRLNTKNHTKRKIGLPLPRKEEEFPSRFGSRWRDQRINKF